MPRPFLALLLLCAPAWGQVDSVLSPRELERGPDGNLPFSAAPAPGPGGPDRSAVLMPELRRLVLTTGGTQGPAVAGSSEPIGIHGLSPTLHEALTAALRPWLARPLTETGLDRMTDAILFVYQANDRPVVDIAVPGQDLRGGTLVIEVTEGRVGAVGMERTRQFNDELLGGAIHLEHGDLITVGRLQEQLDWLNRNPFRPASVYAAPGGQVGEADFVFTLDERPPWRVYAGYENSGTEAIGEDLFFAGFNWGNAFGCDHLLSYQFTIGESLDRFQAHSVAWEIPLHRMHRFVRIHATWTDAEGRSVIDGMPVDAEGETWVAGAAWGIPLPRCGDLTHDLQLGAEFKASDNLTSFGDFTFPDENVEIAQLRVDYLAQARTEDSSLDAGVALVASPGGVSGLNDDAAFEAFRAGAESQYAYLRGELTWTRRLPDDWSLRLAFEGQVATGELLALEQIAFGGHDSIRGFKERDYLADHGYIISSEVRTPALGLVVPVFPTSQFQLLAFVDHGTGWRDGDGRESFTGAGAGIRLDAIGLGEFRCDLAWPLGENNGPEIHAGVLMAF